MEGTHPLLAHLVTSCSPTRHQKGNMKGRKKLTFLKPQPAQPACPAEQDDELGALQGSGWMMLLNFLVEAAKISAKSTTISCRLLLAWAPAGSPEFQR